MSAGIPNFTGNYGFDGVTNILAVSVRCAGQIDPTTDFNVGGGTLDLSGGDQTIGGLSGGGEATVVIGASTLTVDQEEDSEFAGEIEGDGGFTKSGSGTLHFTGNSRSEEHTSELQSLMRISYAVFCLKKKKQ